MRLLRRGALALLFVVTLLTSFVMPSGTASATSIYDDSYQGATSLYTSSSIPGQACNPADVTFNWSSYLTDSSKWYGNSNLSATRASFLSALANDEDGAWGVHQYSNGSLDIIEFWWTEDSSAHLVWSADGVSITTTIPGANIYLADVLCTNYYYGGGSSIPVVGSVGLVHSYKVSTSLSSSLGYTAKPLFIHGFDINYPSDYEGEIIPTVPPLAEYVAMGDSVSSAEGNPSFEPGTDQDGVNECHRSSQGYPRLLQSHLTLEPMAFVACSGATTNDVLGVSEDNDPIGKWGEPAQISMLSESAKIVTISIGGNDVGFATYATNCAVAVCGPSSMPYSNIMQAISDPAFKTALIEVYEGILGRASQAKLYVLGYPRMTPPADATNCTHTPDANDLGPRDVVDSLNAVIFNAVDDVKANTAFTDRIEYVEANATNPPSPFLNAYICSSAPAFNDVNWSHTEYSYHPNALGHLGYKQLLQEAIE